MQLEAAEDPLCQVVDVPKFTSTGHANDVGKEVCDESHCHEIVLLV